MILTATINEVKRRILFDNPQAVVAVKGDYEVNGIAFAFPAIYEDDFDLSTAVKTVYYKATDGIIYNHIVTETDTDTGYPLWVFKDEINKGAYGDVEFALVCDKVENGNIVKRWVSMITAFRVQKSIEIDESEQEDNEQTYSERLAYLMTQVANMQTSVTTASESASAALTKANAVDARLNNIIIESGTSEAEVVAARTNSDTGTTYNTLGARLDTEYSEIKEDLFQATDNERIPMTVGGYIKTNVSTGIDFNSPVANANYRYGVVPCSEGDVFTINATGASVGRAYAFITSNGDLVLNASSNVTLTNAILTAPENSAYLIINDNNTGAISYKGILLKNVAKNTEKANRLVNLDWHIGSLDSTTGQETTLSYRERTQYIPATEGDTYIVGFDTEKDRAYIFEYADSKYGANNFIRYLELNDNDVYVVSSADIKYVRFVFGTRSKSGNIAIDYADRNLNVVKQVSRKAELTFITGNYMTANGAHSASGWSYTNNIPCSAGDYIRVIGAYSPDYRPLFFFDDNDNVVGLYDTGKNIEAVDNFVCPVPHNANYAVVNTSSSARTDLKVFILNNSGDSPDNIVLKSLETTANNTGHKLSTIFDKIKSNGALFTIVDDDGRNLTQVSNFHNICVENGVIGCNALATKFINDMSASDKEAMVAALKNYESEGFQNVLHCYNHDYWESSINASMDSDTRFKAITADIVKGMRDMADFGFIDWKHWIVPQGKTGLEGVQEVARNLGFNAIYDVANNSYNSFVPRDNLYNCFNVPRMELYPKDTGHGNLTLQLIKEQADLCAKEGGWLIVCTHLYQTGWTENDPTYSRVSEMIQYIMNLGFKNVTLSGGMSYWEDIYRMYDLF